MQDTTVVAKVVSQTLDVLAVKFGATGAHLWKILVQQVYVDASIALFIVIMISTVTFFVWQRYNNAIEKQVYDTEGYTIAVVISSIVCLLAWTFCSTWVFQLFNPEYAALREVLSAMKH